MDGKSEAEHAKLKKKTDSRSTEERKQEHQRKIPNFIRKLLEWDADLTNSLCRHINNKFSTVTIKSETKFMEISCSGYFWIPGCLIVLLFLDQWIPKHVVTNLLVALVIDAFIVALIKAFTRRRRPPGRKPDFFGPVHGDKFSFPSGHATRSILIVYVFTQLCPLTTEWYLHGLSIVLLWFWSFSVSISRVINGRHFIFDVVAGVLIGLLETRILRLIWMSPEQADSFIKLFKDEQLDEL